MTPWMKANIDNLPEIRKQNRAQVIRKSWTRERKEMMSVVMHRTLLKMNAQKQQERLMRIENARKLNEKARITAFLKRSNHE